MGAAEGKGSTMATFEVVRAVCEPVGIVAWTRDAFGSDNEFTSLDEALDALGGLYGSEDVWGVRVVDGSTEPDWLAPWDGSVIWRMDPGHEPETVR